MKTVATLGTRRVPKGYWNGTINIFKSRLEVYLVNTSVVLVLFGYSKGARKVSEKCIKGTPALLRRCLQGTRLSITAQDYFSWITSHRQAQFLADLYLSWSTMPRFVLTTHMTERAVALWLALWCWSSESEATVGSTPDRESVKDRFQFFWDTVCTNTVALVS